MALVTGLIGWEEPPTSRLTSLMREAANIEAMFWMQIVEKRGSSLYLRGLGTSLELQHSPEAVIAVMGHDSAQYYIAEHALWDLSGRLVLSDVILGATNGHGQALVFQEQDLVLYNSLEDLESTKGVRLILSDHSGVPRKIVAGASHFLILTSNSSLLSFSSKDNRFGQLGSPDAALGSLQPVAFFDGLEPVDIAAGDLHSAVLTADGALYTFGSDAHGQLGVAQAHGEPSLVELDLQSDEEQPDFMSIACGSAHTAAVTTEGQVWVTGQNHYGQLGLSDLQARGDFTSCPLPPGTRATKVLCSRWTTVVKTA